MRNITAFVVVPLLLLCSLFPVASNASILPQKPNIHEPFGQYEATIFLNQDQPLVADWEHVPWSGEISSVQRLANGLFMVGVKDCSEFWVGTVTEIYGNASSFARVTLPAPTSEPTPTTSSSSPWLNKWLSTEHGHDDMILCRLPNTAAGFDTALCGVASWTTNSQLLFFGSEFHVQGVTSSSAGVFPIKQIAVEYSLTTDRTPVGLYFASQGGLSRVALPVRPAYEKTPDVPNVTALFVTLTNTTGSRIPDANVTSVWCFPQSVPARIFNTSERLDAFYRGQCYVGSANNVCIHNGACPPDLIHRVLAGRESYFYRTPGIIDRLPNGVAYDAHRNALHLGNDKCLNVLYANDSLWRVDGKSGGLPMNRIKSVSASGASVWYGTERGVNVMLSDGSWKYFYGPRWLPVPPGVTNKVNGNDVVGMATATAGDLEVTVIATRTGLSVIRKAMWSLAEKAAAFQIQHDIYHNRHGLSTERDLTSFGNKSSLIDKPTANDGLWTSIYLHGQAFRYASETDPELKAAAKVQANTAFAGMQMLFEVTGLKGYPARGFMRTTRSPGPHWHASPTMPGYWYDSATSSDEITGHMSAYPIYHDLVCETEEEKTVVKQLVADLVSRIVDHGNNLVGEDGKPTKWGVWGTHDTNNVPLYYDGRGLNSLEYMMILSGGYHVTANETYTAVFVDLVQNYGYAENAIHSKVTQASDVNYSDDELNFISYLGLLWSSNNIAESNVTGSGSDKLFKRVQYEVLLSIQRTFYYDSILKEKSSWWSTVYAAYMKHAPTIMGGGVGLSPAEESTLMGPTTGAVSCFRSWSTSWVTWPIDNSKRLDITLNPNAPQPSSENLLPYDENPLLLWNNSPYKLVEGNGLGLRDPSAWLTPYWTARFFGLLNDTQPQHP